MTSTVPTTAAPSIPAMFRPSGAPLPGIPQQPTAQTAADTAGRTLTYPILGGGSLTATCPKWCTTDHSSDVERGLHPADLLHQGDAIAISFTTEEGSEERLLEARIAQSPFANGDGSERPYIELLPDASSGESLGYQTAAEVNETIRRVEDHLYALRKLSAQLAEARAEEHETRQRSFNELGRTPGREWLSLLPDDVKTMPVAYLLKAFRATVVEVEPDAVGIDGELSSSDGHVVITLPRILTQILRETAVRRLLLAHLMAYRPW